MSNVYTEDFRVNAVSVVRAGIPVHALARRLMIPETSIRNWMANPKYANIGPANTEILNNIPEKVGTRLIQVARTENESKSNSRCTTTPIKIKTGKIEIELMELSCFKEIVKVLEELNVL